MTQPKTAPQKAGRKRSLLAQERSRDTRQAIIRAALELWSERGYDTGIDGTTAEQIAERAGVSKATFYLHFARKEDILMETAWATTKVFYEDALQALLRDTAVDEVIDDVTVRLCRRMDKVPRPVLQRILRAQATAAAPQPDPDDADRFGFQRAFALIFLQAQQAGDLPQVITAAALGGMFEAMLYQSLREWATDEKANLLAMLRERFAVLLAGARTVAAQALGGADVIEREFEGMLYDVTIWLRTALSLAARGWHVFPCAIGGKRPALHGNWQDLATTDPGPIRRWWDQAPYNIGVSCGPSGLVIVDLDTPKTPVRPGGPSPGRTGTHSLTALCAAHGEPFPHATFTVATPSGGVHLYFRATGRLVRNTAGRLGPLIDTRADGGYVVGPGSCVDGREYTVVCQADPAPFPDWLADALAVDPRFPPLAARPLPAPGTRSASAYAMAALRDETRRMATAVDGTRHDTLNKAAFSLGQLVAAGLLPDLAVITSLADAARQSGLPDRDIHRIIRSAMAAGARKPRASLRAGPSRGPCHLPRRADGVPR